MTLRIKIREVREKRNLNQGQLAKRIGVSRQAVNYLEKKAESGELENIRINTLDKLCEALGVLPGELFEYVPTFHPEEKQVK